MIAENLILVIGMNAVLPDGFPFKVKKMNQGTANEEGQYYMDLLMLKKPAVCEMTPLQVQRIRDVSDIVPIDIRLLEGFEYDGLLALHQVLADVPPVDSANLMEQVELHFRKFESEGTDPEEPTLDKLVSQLEGREDPDSSEDVEVEDDDEEMIVEEE